MGGGNPKKSKKTKKTQPKNRKSSVGLGFFLVFFGFFRFFLLVFLGVQTTLRGSRNIQIPFVYYTIKAKHLINI